MYLTDVNEMLLWTQGIIFSEIIRTEMNLLSIKDIFTTLISDNLALILVTTRWLSLYVQFMSGFCSKPTDKAECCSAWKFQTIYASKRCTTWYWHAIWIVGQLSCSLIRNLCYPELLHYFTGFHCFAERKAIFAMKKQLEMLLIFKLIWLQRSSG